MVAKLHLLAGLLTGTRSIVCRFVQSPLTTLALTLHAVAAKELVLYPRQDVYVEKQRPTWSYRTSILQVGKTDAPDAEYRAFLAFDLSTVAGAHARVLSAKLRLHPLLASSNARLTHHACLLSDVTWRSDELTWENQPDAQCRDRSAPCCGNAIGSWQPRPSAPAEVELTYYVKAAIAPGADRLLALHLYAPTAASTREHYYVQYGSSRRSDAATRPELVLEVIAPTSSHESLADGKGLYRAHAGSPSLFTLAARDAEGVAQTAGGDDFRVGLTSRGGVVLNASVADVGNGTYSVEYTPTVSGVYRLDVSLGGLPVADSPYTLSVFPAPTSPAHCVATGAGLLEATAGVPATLLLTPRDSFGNARPLETGDVFTVHVARRGERAAAAASKDLVWQAALVTDLLNGTYSAEYLVKQSGAYLVRAQLGGVHIMGSPFQATVLAGRTSARASSALGAGLRTAIAGQPASFTIVARDEYGNARSICGDQFVVSLSGTERDRIPGSTSVRGVVSESGNGTYLVEYTVTSAGLYHIAVTLDERHVEGSPFGMQAFPSVARASHTTAFGDGLSSTVAGTLTEFQILSKDTYGNAERASAGGNFSVTLRGPQTIHAKVSDLLSGMYVASYTPLTAGQYAVEVLYDQIPIFGSPYTTIVRPGRAHAPMSVVGCLHPEVDGVPCAATLGIAGEVNAFVVRARDSSGNDCAAGGEAVEAVLFHSGPTLTDLMGAFVEQTRGAGLKATVLDTADGAYAVTYRTIAAGEYKLSVTINGAHIEGSPFATLVQPGGTCAAKSKLSGVGAQTAVAGADAALVLQAVDCYGNAQTVGGDPFVVTMRRPGVAPLSASVIDKANGRYDVRYNATVAGLWQLHVTAGAVHASGSPFNVLVVPGPTSPRASIAVGEGTHKAAIGEPTTVILRAKDQFGNDRGVGGDKVSATLTQGATSSVVHASVRDTGDGSYTVRYTLSLTSWQTDYLMAVRVNNGSLGGSPFRVKPIPGPTVCDQSISVDFPKCIAGAVSEAPIFAKDRLGNQRSAGGDVFSASLELLDKPGGNESVQVGDNGDGSYKAMWVVTRAASHRLWIAGVCGPIKGSPYQVDCVPASLSVSHSQLVGRGVAEGIAGEATPFGVLGRDVFDNVLREGTYTWGASLGSPTASWGVTQPDKALSHGQFNLTYNVTRAGTYELIVGALGADGRVNASMQVGGSPTMVTVRAGPLSGKRSRVFGPTAPNGGVDGDGAGGNDGAWVEGAGRPVRLWIEARDAFDNPHETALEPAPFRLTVHPKNPSASAPLQPPTAVVRAASRGGHGAYTADLIIPTTGEYLVRAVAVLEPGQPGVGGELLGSPYPLRIVAGPTSAPRCTAEGPGLSSIAARVGALQFISITARDMHGNARSTGGDRFALTLDGPNATKLVASSMVDYHNGTYIASYLATVAGNYTVTVQRADEANVFWDIKGSPFAITVGAGPTNPFVSRLVGPHEAIAGEQTAFTLMSRDEFGNAPFGGERHRFDVVAVPRATGAPAPVAQLVDAGKGNYTVLHVFTDAGEYSMRTLLRGASGGALPDFPLRVSPGPLSPPHSELLWPCHVTGCVESSSRRTGYFVGWPVRFSILPFDAYGNRRADAGKLASFVARVHGPRATGAYSQVRCAGASAMPSDAGTAAVHCKAERQADGLYVVEFLPLVRGEFVINVTVHAGPYGQRKLGNLPGAMVVQVDAAPIATCVRLRNCTGHGHCNYLSGRCVCDAGWDGDDCSHGASARRACPGDCSGHGYCSDETDNWGRNLCRCAIDYSGPDCATWVSGGPTGALGRLAPAGPECPNECSGHGACNATCGECACEPGWRGDDCSLSGEHSLTDLGVDSNGRPLVLDYSPATRRFGVYAVHKASVSSDKAAASGSAVPGAEVTCAGLDAKPVCSGTWPVVLDAATISWSRPFLFASLGGGMLLQYEPVHGAYLLLGCDGTCDGGVPCARRLAAGRCTEHQLPLGPSMRASYVGLETVLFHNGATGAYTVHRLARSFLEQSAAGCMFDPPLASGVWAEVGVHRHTWLGVHDLIVDYEPLRGNYSVWRLKRDAQGVEPVVGSIATRGHLMATAKQFVSLPSHGLLLLASDGATLSAASVAGDPPGGAGDGYAVWRCSADDGAYSPLAALPCTPVGQADGLGHPHSCPASCAAGDCACSSKAACVANAGCGWCADSGEGTCLAGDVAGPIGGAVMGASECFAWAYTHERTSLPNGYEPHSYVYVQSSLLLDYAAADGKYNLWKVARPARPGCPGVQWPPAASGTLAVKRHALASVPAAIGGSFGLLDYDPTSGDFRLGACNTSTSLAAGHLACHTSANGTFHVGGMQLLWVGDSTVMRYSRATGQYTLWRYHDDASRAPAAGVPSPVAFAPEPIGSGALFRSDGQRLRDASLTYLDAGELLASVPSTGFLALYRRGRVPAALPAAGKGAGAWSLEPDEGVVPVDGFGNRWESTSVLRGWQFTYVGAKTLMMLKPTVGRYRILDCAALYEASAALPTEAAVAGVAGGPPCALLVEGTLPTQAPCSYSREHCLLAPQCGWCESSQACVAANEEGVCSGTCADGQLLYGVNGSPSSLSPAVADAGAGAGAGAGACSAQRSCDRCTEHAECAWCVEGGGACILAVDGEMGECAPGKLVQYDASSCPLVEEGVRSSALLERGSFPGLVSQVE